MRINSQHSFGDTETMFSIVRTFFEFKIFQPTILFNILQIFSKLLYNGCENRILL